MVMAGNEAGQTTKEKTMTDTPPPRPGSGPDYTAYFVPERESPSWVSDRRSVVTRRRRGLQSAARPGPERRGPIVVRKPKADTAQDAGDAGDAE